MITDSNGYALGSLRDVRKSLTAGAIRLGVNLAGAKTIVDAARSIVLAGGDLRRVWYRLPEEVMHYGDEPLRSNEEITK